MPKSLKQARQKRITMNKNKNKITRIVPNPDSDIVSQIHVIVIAPQTNKRAVTITCLTLQNHEDFIKQATSGHLLDSYSQTYKHQK
jgi:hypothetical protein